MNFIKRWFRSQVQNAWEEIRNEPFSLSSGRTQPYHDHSIKIGTSGSKQRGVELDSNGTHFKLYHANGGYVIEIRNYNSKQDEYVNALHIITHTEDLGKALGHIITLEELRK